MKGLRILIQRTKRSFDYKRSKSIIGDWDNQKRNNSLDRFILYKGDTVLMNSPCQSVSNTQGLIEGTRESDTIAPGFFNVVAYVDQRNFWGAIHGVANTKTMKGEEIRSDSTTATNASRWLIHDWQKSRLTSKPGVDTSVAWSGGCFVIPDAALKELDKHFQDNGVKPGDIVPGLLVEGE